MIHSFGDRETESLFSRRVARRLPAEISRAALRKLVMLDAAERLEHLADPPGNRLEALHGAWQGFHSIRINDQWRLCFRWSAGGAYDVQIVDYH